ncbi:hypothetical protein MM236_12395 [Belliella sp. DSM 107340]|uniref:Uncharacterized protein n=1 Tax=Belliella calami TaxID=2923436 RepID=A0ABS9UQA2_9BACT|nr:hypothetical protein [Belliella calami]MCH7398795.1 hypothetical protein [Belliella calami]
MKGINYNFGFDIESGKKLIYQINAYWVSEDKSMPNFNSGGPTIDLSEFIDNQVGSKSLLNHTIITGLEAGLGYKVLDKNRVKLILSTGFNFQRLIYNEIQTAVIPDQSNMTNFGIYSFSYNKNHLGYHGGITGLAKLTQRIWIGPEIKWRGYFGVNPPIHPVIFNSLDIDSINMNVKLVFDL